MSKILICITGSIAAIKLPELIHRLTTNGYNCRVIITAGGLNFVTPMSISSVGANVYMDNHIDTTSYTKIMQHISLGKWADYILVCPASANSIAKLSMGVAGDLLTATVLASNATKVIVPAMNQQMWKNSLTQKNVITLQQHGFSFWGPTNGIQACGDDDIGRMLEIKEIYDRISNLLHPQSTTTLSGRNIIITAGGTREMIDPVRYISNHSSGKMGYALAETALALGAKVTLISSSNLPPPQGVTTVAVTSSQDMLNVALDLAANADIFVGCAAVCDFMVKNYSSQKIKKSTFTNLQLITTPDILTILRHKYSHLFMVGFAAETENMIENATSNRHSREVL